MNEQFGLLYNTTPGNVVKPQNNQGLRLFKNLNDGLWYVKDSNGVLTLFGNGGGGESLQITLAIGNNTGGNDINVSAGDKINFGSGTFFGSLDSLALSSNRNYKLQDADGTLAFLSDIPASINIYNSDGSLSSARTLDMAGNSLLFIDGANPSVDFLIRQTADSLGIKSIDWDLRTLSDSSASDILYWSDANGIGIGVSSPTARLHIKGLNDSASANSLKIDNLSGFPLLYVANDGFVGAGTNSGNSTYSTFSHKSKATQALGYVWADFFSPNGLTGITFKQDSDIPSAMDISSGSFGVGFGATIFMAGATRQISLGGYPYAGGIINVQTNYQNLSSNEYFGIGSGEHLINQGPRVKFMGAPDTASNTQQNYGLIAAFKENAINTDYASYMIFQTADNISLNTRMKISSNGQININFMQIGSVGLVTGDLYTDGLSNTVFIVP